MPARMRRPTEASTKAMTCTVAVASSRVATTSFWATVSPTFLRTSMTRPATLLVSDSCEPTRASTRCSSARAISIWVSRPAPPDRAERARFCSAEIWPLRLVICDCAALTWLRAPSIRCAVMPPSLNSGSRRCTSAWARCRSRRFSSRSPRRRAICASAAASVWPASDVGAQALLFELLHLGPGDVHFLVVAGGGDRAEHLADGDHLAFLEVEAGQRARSGRADFLVGAAAEQHALVRRCARGWSRRCSRR